MIKMISMFFCMPPSILDALVFILLLQKSVKSLQLVLNELFVEVYIKNTVTSSAYVQFERSSNILRL